MNQFSTLGGKSIRASVQLLKTGIKQMLRVTEDEMVGWHHRLSGHEFEQVLRVGDGCCSPWGHRVGHD